MNGHNSELTIGFERDCVVVPIASLTPFKPFQARVKKTKKYQQIVASIHAIGIVEPPVILANRNDSNTFYILDGNLRVEALKELNIDKVECLLSKTDDTYTYNRRVNRLAAAQDRRMIVQAINRGVPQQRIADTLGLDISSIRRRVKLLDGICDEVRDMLADKPCPMKIFSILRDMTPLRQIEAAELMMGSANYSVIFSNAILSSSKPHELIKKEAQKIGDESLREIMARQEKELAALQVNLKGIEETFGEDTLLLTVTQGYLRKLLNNAKIVMWMSENYPEYLTEFQAITEISSLTGLNQNRDAA
ncbi:MAG: plasmid partitioning protein RepB C-terminal domain-containing protein [Spongiibacteraceae bacterium]